MIINFKVLTVLFFFELAIFGFSAQLVHCCMATFIVHGGHVNQHLKQINIPIMDIIMVTLRG